MIFLYSVGLSVDFVVSHCHTGRSDYDSFVFC